MWRALALDLGSTRLKLAALDERGALTVLASEPAPQVREAGLECDFDAEELDAAIERLLASAAALDRKPLPLGIACQRSSFLAWDATSGEPLTRVLSWRDRRAQSWCDEHRSRASWYEAFSGLRLSPHYLGPKLAVLARAGLFREHAGRDVRVGTLDSFVIARRRPRAERHTIDASMAARTLLFDVRAGAWNSDALAHVGAPRRALPDLRPSCGRNDALSESLHVAATLSDQAAAFLAVSAPGAGDVLVNLGTGGFVLREVERFEPRAGYLCGPLLANVDGTTRFALEGTINAGAAGLDAIGGKSEAPRARDDEPDLYCAPEDGVGAPHWRAELAPSYSRDVTALSPATRRRAFLEGLVFRVRELVDALDPSGRARVKLSGGVARDPFVAPALATLLARELEQLDDHESTLLGAARLAAGLAPFADPPRSVVRPTDAPLRAKYERWLAWRAKYLSPA
jgi:glycerol kinase